MNAPSATLPTAIKRAPATRRSPFGVTGLLLGIAVLLLAAFRPVPASPSPRRRPVVHRPRHAAPPPRQARAIPPRIPDYAAFAACAEAHSARWETTYEYGSASPYRARNRVTGHVVAVSDLDLLDHILTTYEPPHPVRGYYGQLRGPVRAHAAGAAR
ncbi:hypothetical protein [Thermobifida halotolerans]|uniref:hypothetical protein n=1 Tax=Thermobifida halotolerans TaxID=483545 RepID=UPI000AD11739|nr:hypothetical protein [Thermobifida halotolerans]